MITIERAAPLLTVQDRGRFGYLASGVTRSGPLDALAMAVANDLVGNDDHAATLEGCLGGASVRFDRATTFALTGADVVAACGEQRVDSYVAYNANAGDVLVIEKMQRGAIWYLAIRGGVDAPIVLGSRSTLVSAGLGGIDGGAIKRGTAIQITDLARRAPVRRHVPRELRTALDASPIPLCPAPRSDALNAAEWSTFFSGTFTVSHSVSRVGYRLTGPVVPARLSGDLPSEPACAGAMQLPPEGQPIVLMADHPTIGGYPYIGVVPAHALGRFAQRAPGTPVQFTSESEDDARAEAARQRDTLLQWATRG